MTLAVNLLAAAETLEPLLMPPLAFAGIGFAVFLLLGVVTWSYRDVSNRRRPKPGAGGHDSPAAH